MTIMANYQDGFIVREQKKRTRLYIDNEFFEKGYAALLHNRSLVYECLAKYARADTQMCYPSYETIIKETGIKNRNTIAQTINLLEYLRLIGVKRGWKGRSNRYYLLHHSEWRALTSITSDTALAVSKMGTKEYQERRISSTLRDTRNQRIKSTSEIGKEDLDKLKESRAALVAKLKIPPAYRIDETL